MKSVSPTSPRRFASLPRRALLLPKITRLTTVCLAAACFWCVAAASNAKAFTYSIDDGIADAGIGLSGSGDLIALNSFSTVQGTTVTSISIAFGAPAISSALNGLPFQAILWSDPNGDGNPADAAVLATANGMISGAGTNTFVSLSISPTPILTANFFVGFILTAPPSSFPGAVDETSPILPDRSFVTAAAPNHGNIFDLGSNSLVPLSSLESAGVPGNWLIRAGAEVQQTVPETGTGLLLLSIAFSTLVLIQRGVRARAQSRAQ